MAFSAIIIWTVLVLAVCSFFPGFFVVRRQRWTPCEKLCGAAGLSLIFVYLAFWASYVYGPANLRPVCWIIVAAAGLTAVSSWREAFTLFRQPGIRRALLSLAFLLVWTLTMLSMIRVYSALNWAVDWAEHFQRSLLFLNRLDPAIQLMDLYPLPARPPMQNVLAAAVMGVTGDRYEVFQVVFAFWGILPFLGCYLLLPALGFGRRHALPLLALFALNPQVMLNATYTWTKALTAFYVLAGVAFYLAGLRKRDRVRTAFAFLALAAGSLTHYSAGPFAVVIGTHYVAGAFKGRFRQIRDFPLTLGPALLLLLTWFAWSFHTYGARTTLASNTSVTSSQADPSPILVKIGQNLADSIVPVWMRGPMPAIDQPNASGRLRDTAFIFYQLNLIFAMGAVGGPLIAGLVVFRTLRGSAGRHEERVFWRLFIPACIVLGIAVVGERDPLGVPHLTLFSLQLAGLTALAAAFGKLNRPLKLLIIAGCCADFYFGILLHARVQGIENTATQLHFPEIAYAGGQFIRTNPTSESLSEAAWRNWLFKHRFERFGSWLQDLPRGHESDTQFASGWPQMVTTFRQGIESDEPQWGGWLSRHGGVIEYLGDHVAGQAGTGITTALFVALFGCVAGLLAWSAITLPGVAAAMPTGGPRPAGRRRTSRARRE